MKLINKYTGGLAAIATVVALLTGCEKRETYLFPTEYDLNKTSQVQVFLATVNATRNNIYLDGTALSGATIASGAVSPAGSGTIAYAVPGGFRAFLVRDTLAAATQIPLSFAENFQVGRNYTIFVYDTINSPKQKTVQTNIVVDSVPRLRFANFVYNPTAVPNVDVFSFRRNANIFTNIAVTDVTEFRSHSVSGALGPVPDLVDTLYIREAGTLNQLVKIATPSLLKGRSYTAVFRGSFRAATRTVTVFANY